MADYTVTPASVIASSAGLLKSKRGIAGATITAGQPLYLDADDDLLKLALASAPDGEQEVVGISLNAATSGQPVVYTYEDSLLAIGAAVASGATVVLSNNAGRFCPDADISGGFKVILGVGVGSNKITFVSAVGGLTTGGSYAIYTLDFSIAVNSMYVSVI